MYVHTSDSFTMSAEFIWLPEYKTDESIRIRAGAESVSIKTEEFWK